MARLLILDTIYPQFLASLPFDSSSDYETELRKVLGYRFGTFDAYSRNLRAMGHECIDVIANHTALQSRWMYEHGGGPPDEALVSQINYYRPDVVFLQDLSIQIPQGDYLIAGQCSCRFPEDKDLRKCDVIFSSIPSHVEHFNSMDIRSVFCPLAFEPSVLSDQPERDLDVVFVGGLGRNSYWKAGVELFERIAEEIDDNFVWYGYTTGPISPKLQSRWEGTAWGTEMYQLYQRAKIVVNRHGEISQGATNNLRTFEATGCGAMLLTEESSNIWDLFQANEIQTYLTPQQAIMKIQYYLANDSQRAAIAARGQKRTLKDHTYAQRMKTVSRVLMEMLCPA